MSSGFSRLPNITVAVVRIPSAYFLITAASRAADLVGEISF
jgi:hypothetical protein